MVKTTVNLSTEVYRELVKDAVEKYGTTKTLSRIINERLSKGRRSGVDIVKETSGLWIAKESGYEYTRRIRAESERRIKAIA